MSELAHIDKVETLFHEALARDADTRSEFLWQACSGDPAVMAEVTSLLTSFEQDKDFLQQPAFRQSASQVASSVLGADKSDVTGSPRIADYVLIRRIGDGGMGVVYEARSARDPLARPVAVKVVKRGMETDFMLRRFERERRIMGELEHSYIARVVDGGTTEDNLPYFVMEYVEGCPIDQYVAKSLSSVDERLQLFLKVCDAVSYAHQHRIIHRDLKPSNILITHNGMPKLLDFGIAKLLDLDIDGTLGDHTATVHRVMTPRYASPEQLSGRPPTVASDVYSLGVLLFRLLTGEHPYEFQDQKPDEILRCLETRQPRKPSEAATKSITSNGYADQVRNEIKGNLDKIVLKALRREPERRYQSVSQFAEDIRRHLGGQPILARADSVAYRSVRFLRRHQMTSVLVLLATILCLSLGILVASLRGENHQRRSVAVLPFAGANQSSDDLSDLLTDSLIDSLSRVPDLTVPARNSVFRLKGQSVSPVSAARSLGVETILTGEVSTAGDGVVIKISLIDAVTNQAIFNRSYQGKTSDIQNVTDQIVVDVSRDLRLPTPAGNLDRYARRYTRNPGAYLLYMKGRYFWNKRDGESLRKAVEYFEKAIAEDSRFALAYSGVADCHSLLYIYGGHEDGFTKGRLAAQKALELDSELAEAHASMAFLLWLQDWNWTEADQEFKKALRLNPKYATAHHWYSLFLAETGRTTLALERVKHALTLDPLSLPINSDFGRILYFARRYDESLEQFQKTLEMDPNFKAALADVRPVYEQKGMYNDWLSAMDKLNWENQPQWKQVYLRGGIRGYRIYRLKDPSTGPNAKAEMYTQIGQKEMALKMLRRFVADKGFGFSTISVNPVFDPLRSDPRFQELLGKIDLPPGDERPTEFHTAN